MQPAKVMIVDDHTLFRQGVRAAIERDGDFQVVGEAADGREALAQARALRPDLVLMDINMPGLNGLEAVREIKGALPSTKVIMLTVRDDEASLLDAIKGGAEGFLGKNIRGEALRASLRGAMTGQAAIPQRMFASVLQEVTRLARIEAGLLDGQLTYREKQVLARLLEGLSNVEIADALCVSDNTVKAHLGHIFTKLNVHSRSEAAAYARRLGLGAARY